MATSRVDALMVDHVHQRTQSLTPTDLLSVMMASQGVNRRSAKASLTRCVENNLLTYRQQLGRTVVVPSLNCYYPLVSGVVLAPPHLPGLRDGTHCISMKEGISFGNGTHPTTRLCAGLMVAASQNGIRWQQALDLGTGTGVLSLLALKLGCDHVDATEIDPIAMHDARENALFNDFSHRLTVYHADGFCSVTLYQMVTANLRYPTLVSLKGTITSWVDTGGDLILSGIKEGEEERVKAVYSSSFVLKDEKSSKGWVGLHLKKSN
ncbi:50S ribosomal protein L11 methyltransferase [Desulfoluna sp.]|uniref:50S ribosomal protein L11 methyltransferase n=1 Tax=Desulfoluna sp. TaxID=2045199 RepID=UPI00260CFB10|nr:50S ribosomal protein L11 methyltransferase [Desulfoluna sp.]